MNDQTYVLLEKLASKLGTTTEYLWSILMKQAPVEGAKGLILAFFLLLSPFFTYKLHVFFNGRFKKDGYHDSYYEEPGPGIIMLFSMIGTVAAVIVSITLILDSLNAFYNPEYWALKEILNTVYR